MVLPRIRFSKRFTAAFAACLFLLVLGAKWATFDRFGSPMPDWDQWDAEASHLLIPWYERDNFLSHLFAPHNEHRVVLTKLQNLALTLLNGQWDARLEAVTNAILHSVLAVAFWLMGCRWIAARHDVAQPSPPAAGASLADASGRRRPSPLRGAGGMSALLSAALFILTAVLFGLPLAWQNVLGGFHSQQYWLLLLSFAAIVTLPFARPWTAAWWVGAIAAVLALGSMGSGFLAAAVVLMVIAWRLWQRETNLRTAWPAVVLCSLVVAAGLLTRTDAPGHESLKAKTLHDFFFSIVHSLQWPLRNHHWAAIVMWLPWFVVAWRLLIGTAAHASRSNDNRGGGAATPTARVAQTLVALGGWVLIQVVATAYARGVGADYPASRYMDTLAFGAMVNGIAIAWLLAGGRRSEVGSRRSEIGGRKSEVGDRRSEVGDRTSEVRGRRSEEKDQGTTAADTSPLVPWSFGPLVPAWVPALVPSALVLLLFAWLATFGFGLRNRLRDVRIELPDAKAYYVNAESNMRRYLATNDPKELTYPDIPFPSAAGLIERLANPHLRALMPVPIRAPLEVVEGGAGLPPASDPAGGTPALPASVPAFLENNALSSDPEHPPGHGLSPATPPLEAAKTWGSFPAFDSDSPGVGEWRSVPLTTTIRGWLKFETAGHLGNPNGGVALELRSAATDALLASVRPTRVPGDSWRAAYARAPREPFVIVARDEHVARWLAFSGPVEMGGLSYRAWRASKHGVLICYVAGFATLILLVVAIVREWTQRESHAAATHVSVPKETVH